MKKKTGKIVAAASAMALLMGTVGVLPTIASMNPTAHQIAEVLGIKKDLGEYANVVNQGITKNGITIELSDVIIDNEAKELVVATTITSEKAMAEIAETDLMITEKVFVNGALLNEGATATSNIIDAHTAEAVVTYYLPEAVDGEADVKVRFATAGNVGASELCDWEFEFTADGEELEIDTQIIAIDKTFAFGNGAEMTVDRFTSNALGQSIYFSTQDNLNNYLYQLQGTDNLGNKVVFDVFFGKTGVGGEMKLTVEESNLAADAESMALGLYAIELPKQDGPILGEYEQVGEHFVIKLK